MRATTFLVSALAGLANGLASTDTITWGGDNSRTGYQTNHNMDPAVVGSSQFGPLFKTNLPGNYGGNPEQIFSQPLVYTPSGGTDQFVYFATTQNNVYKLNAKTGAIVAKRNLHIPFLSSDLDGCIDIQPHVGITATGVIDPATDTLYLSSKTYLDQTQINVAQGRPASRYYVHALNVNDLSERPGYPIMLDGTAARNSPQRVFTGGIHHQRPALLDTGKFIYMGFASHCVQYNFTGWIIGFEKASGNIVERWTTEGAGVPMDIKGGGIWMSGGGLSSDDAGSIFFGTGNGYASQLSNVPVQGFNPPTSIEEAACHMTQNEDGSLNLVDFFMPWEKQALDGADKDLGTSPLEILPSQFSCGNVKRMGVITGKSGKTYWLNLDDLGGYRNGADGHDKVIQVFQNENSVYAGAGVYPLEGGYIYINVIQYKTHVFKFSCDNGVPSFAKVADSPNVNAYILGVSHGTTTSLNNQPGTGLLWVTDVQGYNLRIYNAVPNGANLTMINQFNVPGTTKFTRPVFGDGIVYMGTTQGYVQAFGSPVNAAVNCTSPVDFGKADIKATTAAQTITCTALTNIQVTGISIDDNSDFDISNVPATPLTVAKGGTFKYNAVFHPSRIGFISDDVIIQTTAGDTTFSSSSHARLTGTGTSAGPLLALSPDTVTFDNVVAAQDSNGVSQSAILSNNGNAKLTVQKVLFSSTSSTGPYTASNGGSSVVAGKFTVSNIPATMAGNQAVSLNVNFNSTDSGTFSGFVKFITDGGNKTLSIAGSAGPPPKALLEFQTPDGTGWVTYKSGTPFTFGNITENTSKTLKFRVTNNVTQGGVKLDLTVSKPPFNVPGIVRATSQTDLGEGTSLGPGESQTANLVCGVPKSQVNIAPYNGTAQWTMNTNDPTFDKQFIQFFCNAVSEQFAPLLPNGQGKYGYVGCFKENNPGRQLDYQLQGNANMSNALCISACAAGNYTFCGSQYHTECWAGNRIPAQQVDDGNCNFYCGGAIQQTCGGNGLDTNGAYISLFANSQTWNGNYTRPPTNPDGGNGGGNNGGGGTAPAAVVNPGVDGYVSMGCYTEGTNVRALPNGATVAKKTVKNCVDACAAGNYLYAGVEYAGECWCGNAFGTGAVSAKAADCNLACTDNTTELCGGNSRLNVYQKQNTAPTSVTSLTSVLTTTSTTSGTTTAPVVVPTTTTTTTVPVVVTTTTTSSVSSASPTGPSRKQVVNGSWNYLGCYTEGTNARALQSKTYANDSMTLESCATFCSGLGYFGVEYGRECYCGNALLGGTQKAPLTDCKFTCPGNALEYCGAGNRLELYQAAVSAASVTTGTTTTAASQAPVATTTAAVTTAPAPTTTAVPTTTTTTTAAAATTTTTTAAATTTTTTTAAATTTTTTTTLITSTTTSTSSTASVSPTPHIYLGNANYTYYHCLSEPDTTRLLPQQVLNNGTSMTPQMCLSACGKNQYQYAGIEYGRECWCGNTLTLSDAKSKKPGQNVTETDCGFLCPGDQYLYCGAGNRMSLWSRNATTPKGAST